MVTRSGSVFKIIPPGLLLVRSSKAQKEEERLTLGGSVHELDHVVFQLFYRMIKKVDHLNASAERHCGRGFPGTNSAAFRRGVIADMRLHT